MRSGSVAQLTQAHSVTGSSKCFSRGNRTEEDPEMRRTLRRRLGRSVKQSASRGLNWAWKYKFRVAVLALVFTLVAPRPAKSQFLDPCCAILEAGLSTIASTLSGVIGGGLNPILSVDQTIRNFEQTVVWPQQLIAEAKALVGELQGVFTEIRSVTSIPVASASLPSPSSLKVISSPRTPIRLRAQARTIRRSMGRFPIRHPPRQSFAMKLT